MWVRYAKRSMWHIVGSIKRDERYTACFRRIPPVADYIDVKPDELDTCWNCLIGQEWNAYSGDAEEDTRAREIAVETARMLSVYEWRSIGRAMGERYDEGPRLPAGSRCDHRFAVNPRDDEYCVCVRCGLQREAAFAKLAA